MKGLSTIPIRRIIQALAKVADRWREPNSTYRQQAAAISDPFPYPMVSPMLDRLLADWTEERLTAQLIETFGCLEVLDGYHAGRRVLGYPRVAHVLSATPLLGWNSLATALLVKSRSVAKLSSRERCWTPLLVECLREVDPEIGNCVEWAVWERHEEERTKHLLNAADAVVVYGSDESVESVRRMVEGEAPLFAYGNRFSLAIILQEANFQEAAEQLAQDCVALYGTGCLSPQGVWVEGNSETVAAFAETLAHAIEARMQSFPIQPGFGESVAVRREREAALFEEGTRLWGATDLSWTVIARPEPRWEMLGTFNTVQVVPYRRQKRKDKITWKSELCTPNPKSAIRNRIQAVAVAGDIERILPLLEPLCVPRICRVGELQLPPFDWYENGRCLLRDLARWSRIDSSNGSKRR